MALLTALAVPAFAATDTDTDSWTAAESGFEMSIPDTFRDAKGYITFSDLGEGVNPGSGVVQAAAVYVACRVTNTERFLKRMPGCRTM